MASEEIEKAKHALRKKIAVKNNRSKSHSLKKAVHELMKNSEKEERLKEEVKAREKEGILQIISENKKEVEELKSELKAPKPLGAQTEKSLENTVAAISPFKKEDEETEKSDRAPYQTKRPYVLQQGEEGQNTLGQAARYDSPLDVLRGFSQTRRPLDDPREPANLAAPASFRDALQREVYNNLEKKEQQYQGVIDKAVSITDTKLYEPRKHKEKERL